MAKKGKTSGNRVFVIAFFGTLLILSAAVAAMIYLPKIQGIQHIPTSYEVTAPDWFKFIPPGLDKMTEMNFPKIYQTSGNFSMFSSDILLKMLGFTGEVSVSNCEFAVSVFYPNPNPNSDELALNILKPNAGVYSGLQGELEQRNTLKTTYRGAVIYQVTRYVNSTYFVTGYACPREGYIIYSDSSKGLDLMKSALDNEAEGKTITSVPTIKASLYVLDPKNELGFSYSKLPYTVSDVISTSTKLTYEGGKLVTRILFAFNTTGAAQADLEKIKQANLNATEFQVIDNYVLVTARYDMSNILGELRSL